MTKHDVIIHEQANLFLSVNDGMISSEESDLDDKVKLVRLKDMNAMYHNEAVTIEFHGIINGWKDQDGKQFILFARVSRVIEKGKSWFCIGRNGMA